MDQGLFQFFNNKRVRLALLLVFVLLFVYILASYLTSGHITVNTNGPNNVISLIKIDKSGRQITLKYGRGTQLKAAVPGGNYEISVTNKSSAITKNIVVKARHGKTYQLNIPPPVEPVSVLPVGALGLAANSQQLIYLDGATSNVYRLAGSGVPEATGPVALDAAQWSDTSLGVGQDVNGDLYAIRDGSVSPLPVPFNYGAGVHVSYSVSPSGLVYASSGGDIYAGQNGENFHKILTVASARPKLFAGSSKLAIIVSAGDNGDQDSVILADVTGKRLASKTINASSIAWSPDGARLATISDWGAGVVYDASFNKVADLSNSIGNIIWLNNSALLYNQAQDLWEHDVEHGTSQILSSAPLDEQISGIFLNADRSSAFLSAQSQNTPILLRVGLTRQTRDVPPYYSGLGVFFPAQSSQCSFSYSNFLRPFIVITAWSNTDTCADAAKEELKADHLPVSDFTIVFGAPVDT